MHCVGPLRALRSSFAPLREILLRIRYSPFETLGMGRRRRKPGKRRSARRLGKTLLVWEISSPNHGTVVHCISPLLSRSEHGSDELPQVTPCEQPSSSSPL